jgi:hypothetical protein
MSTNSQTVNPVQDLLDRVNELQRGFEGFEPSIHSIRVKSQYERVNSSF